MYNRSIWVNFDLLAELTIWEAAHVHHAFSVGNLPILVRRHFILKCIFNCVVSVIL